MNSTNPQFSKLKYLLYGLVVLLVILGGIWQLARYKVTDIFNASMSRQNIFKGKIITESLDCDFAGNIHFKNLHWTTDQNETIVLIPEGRIKIMPEHIFTFQVSPNTIKEIELRNAAIRLHFDDKLKLDIMKQEQEHPHQLPHDENATKPQEHKPHPILERNLNLPEKLPNWTVIVKNSSVDTFYKNRRYAMKQANCTIKLSNHDKLDLDFASGPLSGTMIGNGINFKGTTLLKEDSINMQLTLKEIVPASLGLGKLSNPVSIQANITGPTEMPVMDGNITFSRLDIRPFVFTEVSGKFHYTNSIFNVSNAHGYVLGGTVDAQGKYNVDTRRYKIDGVAYDLDMAGFTKNNQVVGKANLDFTLYCDPLKKHTITTGNIKIGKGSFKHIHFHSAEADAFVLDKTTYLKNIKFKLPLLHVNHKALSIDHGKVEMHPQLPDEAAIIGAFGEI